MTRLVPTEHERYAAEVIRRVGRWDCTYADTESNGAVDWWLEQEGQRVGGVEVTTVGDRRALQTISAAGGVYWDMPAAQWTWILSYSPETDFREVRCHLEDLVVLCERHTVVKPRLLPWDVQETSAAVQWYEERSGCSLHGLPEASRHGVVDVLPRGSGGAVLGESGPMIDWIEKQLRGDLGRKVRRLDEVPGPERHLFLSVHDSGMPFSHFYVLCATDTVPARDPDLPVGLTALWLLPNLGTSVLWWHRDQGWARFNYSDEATAAT